MRIIVIALIAIVAIASRFIFLLDGMSAVPNFTAIGALMIFAAVYLKSSMRYLIPLFAFWLSDLILNNIVYNKYYDNAQISSDPWVLGSFALCIFLAMKLMRKPSWGSLVLTSIGTGIVFFLITNFAVWLNGTFYTKDLSGLLHSYIAGIPFFRNMLAANLFYGFLFFGIYEYIARRENHMVPTMPLIFQTKERI